MKNLRLILLTAILMSATALSASAQTKVAAVDMKKLFSGFWKTKQATASLENRKVELGKELKQMAGDLEKAQGEYKQLSEQANDPAISPEEHEKRTEAAQGKAKDISTSKAALEQFQRQADTQLTDESQRMSQKLVAEIQKAVADKAKAGGYTVVINSASPESFIYTSPDIDITEAVLAQLNIGAPVDLTKPAGDAPLTISTNLP